MQYQGGEGAFLGEKQQISFSISKPLLALIRKNTLFEVPARTANDG